ncbi:hypothetical protein HDU93_007988 [Gonapodya sp. JEL0774]|nr:hypothetical protein HDU93_007988 [Gonapodya sp. JEL0774]
MNGLKDLFPHLDDATLTEFLAANNNNVEQTINSLLEGASIPEPAPPSARTNPSPRSHGPVNDAQIAQQLQDEEYALQLQIQEEEAATAAAVHQSRGSVPVTPTTSDTTVPTNIGDKLSNIGEGIKRGAISFFSTLRGKSDEDGSGDSGGSGAGGGGGFSSGSRSPQGRYESLPGGDEQPLDRSRAGGFGTSQGGYPDGQGGRMQYQEQHLRANQYQNHSQQAGYVQAQGIQAMQPVQVQVPGQGHSQGPTAARRGGDDLIQF